MIKNRFPKRKNGSVDGVGSVFPEYYQQELDIIKKQQVKEMSEVNKQLEEAQSKLSRQIDRNNSLQTELMEQDRKRTDLKKLIFTQEDNIRDLNLKVKEYESKCFTLNQTLAESEELNKDMTNKLKQYSAEKFQLTSEKEHVEADNKKMFNRLEMEKIKYELLKQKHRSDNNDVIQQNIIFKNQLEMLKQELDRTKESKIFATDDRLSVTKQTETSNDITHRVGSEKKFYEECQKCLELEKELRSLKMSYRDSGKKLLSAGQSLEQLEAMLYKKSAECSALSISMNTLQSKFENVKAQNLVLQEKTSHFETREIKLSHEKELRENMELKNMKLSTDIISIKNEGTRLSKVNLEIEQRISELKNEDQSKKNRLCEQEKKIDSLEKRQSNLLKENERWKTNYENIHNKLLNVEYHKSDAAKVELEQNNNYLKIQIRNLKDGFAKMVDQMSEESNQFKENHERSIKCLKFEKRKLEGCVNNFKTSLGLTETRLQQSEQLSELKKQDCTKLHQRISDLSSKVLFMEEKVREKEREVREKDDELSTLKFEHYQLQINRDSLFVNKKNAFLNKGEGSKWYYDPNKIYSTTNLNDEKRNKDENNDIIMYNF